MASAVPAGVCQVLSASPSAARLCVGDDQRALRRAALRQSKRHIIRRADAGQHMQRQSKAANRESIAQSLICQHSMILPVVLQLGHPRVFNVC